MQKEQISTVLSSDLRKWTITFGGKWIVKELKAKWHDWKDHIDWDTKN